uniref:Uncharacterized protein n=1 Tax=Rhipicephalus pulchellus TaxID=72859 RepID=L7M2R7_RHIPC
MFSLCFLSLLLLFLLSFSTCIYSSSFLAFLSFFLALCLALSYFYLFSVSVSFYLFLFLSIYFYVNLYLYVFFSLFISTFLFLSISVFFSPFFSLFLSFSACSLPRPSYCIPRRVNSRSSSERQVDEEQDEKGARRPSYSAYRDDSFLHNRRSFSSRRKSISAR